KLTPLSFIPSPLWSCPPRLAVLLLPPSCPPPLSPPSSVAPAASSFPPPLCSEGARATTPSYDTVWECNPDASSAQLCDSRRQNPAAAAEIHVRPQSVWLDRETGTKCYMLSARNLFIVWGDTPQYWTWIPL
uniref:Uncharacterized protein n=2 Tax=Aegilops tauschii subsp. strangulata TaxID=200361 RepID=A0A453FUT3_AEGTS